MMNPVQVILKVPVILGTKLGTRTGLLLAQRCEHNSIKRRSVEFSNDAKSAKQLGISSNIVSNPLSKSSNGDTSPNKGTSEKLVTSKSIIQDQVTKFSIQAEQWWDPRGPRKTLHAMNPVRVQYVTRSLEREGKQLSEMNVLDVGCGGGLLSEALARLGARSVTGLDPNSTLISIASTHTPVHLHSVLSYTNISIESFVTEHEEKFDLVIASEVIEHVQDKASFLRACSAALRPGGLMILTTPHKSLFSFVCTIFLMEWVVGMIPRGTHQYTLYIKPGDLGTLLTQTGCTMRDVSGIHYNPLSGEWTLGATPVLFYGVTGRKEGETSQHRGSKQE